MMTQSARHRLLQKLFWNAAAAPAVRLIIRYGRMFDVVVRNYSLIGETNGERWLTSLLDEEPLVLDVGFHDGASTRESLRARPRARVIAFDPSRFARQTYDEHFAQDRRVTFENIGLSDIPGELEFHDYQNMCNSFAARKEARSTAESKYSVPVTTLDEYCGRSGIDRINFLKIDAEGFDLQVLEGAQGLLRGQSVDIFVFEFASGWAAAKRYLWEAHEYLTPLPYKMFHLFNGFLRPFSYDITIDSCCTHSAMYVGVSDARLARGDIPIRDLSFR